MWKGSAKPDGGVCDAHLYHRAWRLGPSGAPSWRTCSRAAAQTTWPSADLQGATHTITIPQTHCWHIILYTWVWINFITSIRFDYPLYTHTHTHTHRSAPPPRCSWSSWPPWSPGTCLCPAVPGSWRSRWTGIGTYCSPPDTVQLMDRETETESESRAGRAEIRQASWSGHTLTAQFVSGAGQHVVEHVESSLIFGLTDRAGLFQQVSRSESRTDTLLFEWRLLTGCHATQCDNANSQSESGTALASLIIHALHTVTETIVSHF